MHMSHNDARTSNCSSFLLLFLLLLRQIHYFYLHICRIFYSLRRHDQLIWWLREKGDRRRCGWPRIWCYSYLAVDCHIILSFGRFIRPVLAWCVCVCLRTPSGGTVLACWDEWEASVRCCDCTGSESGTWSREPARMTVPGCISPSFLYQLLQILDLLYSFIYFFHLFFFDSFFLLK